MKQLVAFSILFCLVFLNVPKSFVHNCEHQTHHADLDNHQHDSDGITSFDIDQDHCFICEFDLDVYNCPEIRIPSFSFFYNYTFQENSINYIETNDFLAFSHRGPPVA